MIKFEGLEEILSKLDKIDNPEKAQQGLKESCLVVVDKAIEKAPKGRTGELARSITSKVDGLNGVVYSSIEYAPYVEYGTGLYAEKGGRYDVPWAYVDEVTGELIWTSGQHPQPFMRPALDESKSEILDIMKEAITID